jgi:predicted translin family RNA/ssDNA-binding protein
VAENDETGSAILQPENSSIREVLFELRQQREEVRALRAEVQGNSQRVVNEVEKLKTERDISW